MPVGDSAATSWSGASNCGLCETPQAAAPIAGQGQHGFHVVTNRRHRQAFFSIGRIADMTDAADCARPGAVSNVGDSILQRSRRRQRNTNIGYILFVFGVVWIMAIAGMIAAAAK
jgi:hypothetical protein